MNEQNGRQAEVDTAVHRAAETHPHLRATLDALRGHLGRAHAHSDAVDDGAWADYRDRLDRGLASLDKEEARASEAGDPAAPDTLFATATQLEIDGWRLHFETRQERLDTGLPSETDRLRALAAAEDQVDAYRRGERSREDVESALAALRV
ncbi:hypothetical protein [Cryptosporangium phraense]|uniref:Uncharacterized protein n=1 Tax=Cryptosporangium phraense TaxID=2593070 RepID=A0A545AY50_9ACTN|nr:hypothetical protein [Cryptosporangium phraense]TQS46266.1 hypothetical protein FL583_02400 [Cryptosporangium phraense]